MYLIKITTSDRATGAYTRIMTTSTNHKNQGMLVVSRHGESEWNLLGVWTGITDVNITEKGAADSRKVGELLHGHHFDIMYTSDLKRTQQTLDAHLEAMEHEPVERIVAKAIQERDYGELTGKNKWEVKEMIGEEAFTGIRRGWDYPVPGGETLKDVHTRVVPFFDEEILPRLQRGENILMVAHGNSIRALMKHLEEIPEDDMAEVEMPFGTVLFYWFDETNGKPIKKDVKRADIAMPNA